MTGIPLHRFRSLVLVAALAWLQTACCGWAEELSAAARQAIGEWLAFQHKVRTVEAEFVQVRELRTLRQGLTSEGTLWIDRSGARFRWQTGEAKAPKSIAIKNGGALTLIQPGRKRARRISLASAARSGSSEAAFDLAAGSLPATLEGLTKQFSILEAQAGDGQWRIRLAPRDGRLREAVSEIAFVVDARGHHLQGFEMTLRDGSEIRTRFEKQRFNLPLDDTLFEPDLAGYDVEAERVQGDG